MATTRSASQEWYTYVLKLKHGKYYVGKSRNPAERSQNHWDAVGAEWTKEHPPIKLECVYGNYQSYDELRYTLLMMNCYGIDNVRGANFCRVKLTDSELTVIDAMLVGESDCCYHCGKSGHFVRNCYKLMRENIASRFKTDDDDDDDDEEGKRKKPKEVRKDVKKPRTMPIDRLQLFVHNDESEDDEEDEESESEEEEDSSSYSSSDEDDDDDD
jgi:hypothetical protein